MRSVGFPGRIGDMGLWGFESVGVSAAGPGSGFIAGQVGCTLHRHLDSVEPETDAVCGKVTHNLWTIGETAPP